MISFVQLLLLALSVRADHHLRSAKRTGSAPIAFTHIAAKRGLKSGALYLSGPLGRRYDPRCEDPENAHVTCPEGQTLPCCPWDTPVCCLDPSNVCCPEGSFCVGLETCCREGATACPESEGCCAPDATCCGDGCCPAGSECAPNGVCTDPGGGVIAPSGASTESAGTRTTNTASSTSSGSTGTGTLVPVETETVDVPSDDPSAEYSGEWETSSEPASDLAMAASCRNGTKITNSVDAALRFTFEGTGIALYTVPNYQAAEFEWEVEGSAASGLADDYRADRQGNPVCEPEEALSASQLNTGSTKHRRALEIRQLPDGQHTLNVRVRGPSPQGEGVNQYLEVYKFSVTRSVPSSTTTSKKKNNGALIGGIVGGVVGLALAGFLVWWCFIRKKKDRTQNEPPVGNKDPFPPAPAKSWTPGPAPQPTPSPPVSGGTHSATNPFREGSPLESPPSMSGQHTPAYEDVSVEKMRAEKEKKGYTNY